MAERKPMIPQKTEWDTRSLARRIADLESQLAEAQEREQAAVRRAEIAEGIAEALYADLRNERAGEVSAREERERVLKWLRRVEPNSEAMLLGYTPVRVEIADELETQAVLPPPAGALAARLAEALACLKVFARAAEKADSGQPVVVGGHGLPASASQDISLDHCRRAKAILDRYNRSG